MEQVNDYKRILSNSRQVERLWAQCENAKCVLSKSKEALIYCECFDNDKDLMVKLTETKFQNLCKDEIKRATYPTEDALCEAKITANQINNVIMVGGATRMSVIQKLISDIFPNKIRSEVNPDEIVARGAAIYAMSLDNNNTNGIVLIDVTPLSLGVETELGIMHVLIKRNSSIPIKESKVFTTSSDGQRVINFGVYEGERIMAENNTLLTRVRLTDITAAPKGTISIEVTFAIDNNGILNITTVDLSSDKHETVIVHNGNNKEKVTKAIRDAEANREQDKLTRDRVIATASVKKTLSRATEIIYSDNHDLDRVVLDQLNSQINETYSWLSSGERTEKEYTEKEKVIKSLINQLNQSSTPN